jgi:hypothetical protein
MGIPSVRQGSAPPADAFNAAGVENQLRIGQDAQRRGNEMQNLGMDNASFALRIKADQDALLAKDAFLKADDEIRNVLWNPQNGIYTRKGLDTMTAMEDTDKAMTEIYQKHTENLPDGSRRAFNSFFASERANNLSSVARHKASQILQAHDEQNDALLKSNINDASLNWNNQNAIRTQIENGLATIDSIGTLHGIPANSARLAEMKRGFQTDLHSSVINAALAADDIQYANSYFTEHEKEFDEKARTKIGGYVKERSDWSELRQAVDMGADPDIDAKLAERNAKGDYVNFNGEDGRPKISPQNRDRALDYAKNKYTEYANSAMMDMGARMEAGELSHEDIDNSALKNADKTRLHKAQSRYDDRLMNEVGKEISETDKLNLSMNIDSAKLDIYKKEWADDPGERLKQVKAAKDAVYEMDLEPKETLSMLKFVDSTANEHFTYQKNPVWKQGQTLIKQAHDKGINIPGYWMKKKLISDPQGWNTETNTKADQLRRLTETQIWWNSYMKANPETTPEEAQTLIKGRVKDIYEGNALSKLQSEFAPKSAKSAESLVKPDTGRQVKGTGTAPDGRKVIIYNDGTYSYAK